MARHPSAELAEIINVAIAESESGLLTATSHDLPSLYVAGREMDALLEEIPSVIKALIKAQFGRDVDVYRAKSDPLTDDDEPLGRPWPWVTIPVEIAAKALAAR